MSQHLSLNGIALFLSQGMLGFMGEDRGYLGCRLAKSGAQEQIHHKECWASWERTGD